MQYDFFKGLLGHYPYSTEISISPFSGKVFFCDAVNGSDGNVGSYDMPFKTLAVAFSACTPGKGDAVVIISDGSTASSQRLSANFAWNKKNTHLIGMCSGDGISNRARIAPTTGVTAFANFFTVSVDGCYFGNLEFFHGFATGAAAMICMTVTGGRNVFRNCHIAGMGDAASAADTGSRSLLVSGTGENLFEGCTIGLDTISRGVANASVELSVGTPRNVFRDCVFPILATNAGVLGILAAAAAAIDRYTLFQRCMFINAIKSTGVALTGLASLAASAGGLLLFNACTGVGIGKWGADATSLAQCYVDSPVPTAGTSGLAINPT